MSRSSRPALEEDAEVDVEGDEAVLAGAVAVEEPGAEALEDPETTATVGAASSRLIPVLGGVRMDTAWSSAVRRAGTSGEEVRVRAGWTAVAVGTGTGTVIEEIGRGRATGTEKAIGIVIGTGSGTGSGIGTGTGGETIGIAIIVETTAIEIEGGTSCARKCIWHRYRFDACSGPAELERAHDECSA